MNKICRIKKRLDCIGVKVGKLTCFRHGKKLEYKKYGDKFYIFYQGKFRIANINDFDLDEL